MRAAIRLRHYSPKTEETYVSWIGRFSLFRQVGGGLAKLEIVDSMRSARRLTPTLLGLDSGRKGWRRAWERTAATYIAAGNYLYKVDRLDPGVSTSGTGDNWPVMLLYATAAENLLKAIRIAQGKPARVGGKLESYFATHDLAAYAADAGLALGKQQRALLTKLQHVLEAGKYPVAKSPGKSSQAWTWDNPADVEATWKLLQLLDNSLRKTGTKCMDSFEVDKLQYAHA